MTDHLMHNARRWPSRKGPDACDPNDYCEECNEVADSNGLYEYGARFVCRSCWERHVEDSLEREERRHEAGVRYDLELRDRKNR